MTFEEEKEYDSLVMKAQSRPMTVDEEERMNELGKLKIEGMVQSKKDWHDINLKTRRLQTVFRVFLSKDSCMRWVNLSKILYLPKKQKQSPPPQLL